jgi:hypothetical protein
MRPMVATIVFLMVASAALAADTPARVYIDGKLQAYSPAALVRDGQAFVPLRQGAASLGYSCEWLPQENGAKLCDQSGCMLIRKSEGVVVNGSLFLPLRRMAEAFGAKVAWDGPAGAVRITRVPRPTFP